MAWYTVLPWIVAQAKDAAEADATDDFSVALRLGMAVAVVVGSFVGGSLIARALRLPDFSVKIGIVLFTLVASVAICVAGWPPKRGIDLSGGVVLIYEVDKGSAKPSWMPAAITQLNHDLNEGEGDNLEARPAGPDQIEIVSPGKPDLKRIEQAVLGLRSSSGLTLHNSGQKTEDGKTILLYTVDQQHKAVEMDKLVAAVSRRINPGGVKELTIRQYGAEQLEVIVPEVEEREVDQIKKRISTSGLLEFRIVANENDDRDIIRAGAKTPGTDVYIGGKLVGRWVQAGKDLNLSPRSTASLRQSEARGREVLVRIDPFNVDGHYLNRASAGFDEGRLAVNFSFDNAGAERFGQLTRNNLPDKATEFYRHLGIVLDNVMLSAPQINDVIRGNGQITGSFTQEDVDFLVGVLNAGSLPATLRPEPISQQRISSQLGDDTIRQGSMSILISTVAILVFMAVYYRFCGLVADVAVTLNIVITVAIMILIKAAFTLPGLAGLVLTVGMAVDANVLIYERMREESARGASLRMTIRNGYSRAMATIIDSHVTTLMSGVVLYVVGTDQIKGFAVTLVIGLLMSLFTAVFVSRVIFDIAEKKRWLTRLNMMHLIGHTDIDFIRWRTPAIVASVVVSVIGLIAAGARGTELFDIDFTGGSSVEFLFSKEKAHDISEVRKAVEHLPDVAVSGVGDNKLEFKVDTSERDIRVVQDTLQQAFGDSLQTYSMSFGKLSTIEAAKSDQTDAEAQPADESIESRPQEPASDETKPQEPKTDEPSATPEKPAEEKEKAPDQPKAEDAPKPEGATSVDRGGDRFRLVSTGVALRLTGLLVTAQEPAADAEAKDAEKSDGQPSAAPPATAEKEPGEKPAESPASEADKADNATASEESKPSADAKTGEVPASLPATEAMLVGGTRVELSFPQPISYGPLRAMIDKQIAEHKLTDVHFELRNPKYQVGSDASYSDWTLEVALDQEQTGAMLTAIQKGLSQTPVFPSSNQIGGKVASDTQLIALYALLASMAMIVAYVWFRFENVIFGLAAVLALVHDVFITIAFLAVSAYLSPYLGFLLVDPFKISLAVVAALLTIVGFSINDTIVVFDRIREVRGKSPELTDEMVNLSINQTLSRTLLTSGTVLIASVILYFIGGAGIHSFAYSMVVGVIAGTFSSIYIAAPVLLWMKRPTEQKTSRAGRSIGPDSKQAPARGM